MRVSIDDLQLASSFITTNLEVADFDDDEEAAYRRVIAFLDAEVSRRIRKKSIREFARAKGIPEATVRAIWQGGGNR